jgi:hypothetical protein
MHQRQGYTIRYNVSTSSIEQLLLSIVKDFYESWSVETIRRQQDYIQSVRFE